MSKKNEKPNSPSAPLPVLTTETFSSEVLLSKQPVLVAFSTPWSRACDALNSVLEEIASAFFGEIKVVKINADDSLDLSIYFDIQSIPTLLYFVEGKPRIRIVGTATKDAILARLKSPGLAVVDDLASGGAAATSKGGLV